MYRWVIMLYFLVWLLTSILHAVEGVQFKYLIFLTHWGFIAWNSYLVISTITVTAAALCPLGGGATKNDRQDSKKSDNEQSVPGCCKTLETSLKLQWALFLIGCEYAVVISILYWAFYSGSSSEQNLYSLDSLNLHAINGIAAVVELWLSGIPVRACHAIYSIAFGSVYVLFTVLYYAADGRDSQGHRFIYPFLDYGSNAAAAVALAVSCAVFLVGGIHFIFFLQYKGRKCITEIIQARYYTKSKSPATLYELQHIGSQAPFGINN